MIIGDYIIAIKTIRGECKKDRRYKILSIYEKGYNYELFCYKIEYDEDYYVIKHNNNFAIAASSNFIYDYKSNRKIKLKK